MIDQYTITQPWATYKSQLLNYCKVQLWCTDNGIGHSNNTTLYRDWLLWFLLSWVTIHGYTILQAATQANSAPYSQTVEEKY